MGGLDRLVAWHLPGGPVGLLSRWAGVEVGKTTYPVNNRRELRTKSQKGGEARGSETGYVAQGLFAQEGKLYLDIWVSRVPSYANADGACLPT